MKNQRFMKRLGFALNGIREAFKTESSFRTQIFLGGLAVVYFTWLDMTIIWWVLLIIIIAFVLAAELFNTALETLIDHLHPNLHPEIKRIKDISAGAVFILSLLALLFAVLATVQFY